MTPQAHALTDEVEKICQYLVTLENTGDAETLRELMDHLASLSAQVEALTKELVACEGKLKNSSENFCSAIRHQTAQIEALSKALERILAFEPAVGFGQAQAQIAVFARKIARDALNAAPAPAEREKALEQLDFIQSHCERSFIPDESVRESVMQTKAYACFKERFDTIRRALARPKEG
jgi:DNA repair exonuclease SbcCD ATPase subunit